MPNHYSVHLILVLYCMSMTIEKYILLKKKKKVTDLISFRLLPNSLFQLNCKWVLFSATANPPFYFGLIRFFCVRVVSSHVYLITTPRSLSLIHPLWEKQETSHTKSSQIKTELVYISGDIWNWRLLSWGAFTSCRKVNLVNFPLLCMWASICSCEWMYPNKSTMQISPLRELLNWGSRDLRASWNTGLSRFKNVYLKMIFNK